MSLRRVLIWGPGMLLVAVLLNLVLHLYYAQQIQTAIKLSDSSVQRALISQRMMIDGLILGQATRNTMLDPTNPIGPKNHAGAQASLDANLKDIRGISGPSTDDMGKLVDEIQKNFTTEVELQKKIMAMAIGGNLAESIAILNKDETPLWRKNKESLFQIIDHSTKLSKEALAKQDHYHFLSQFVITSANVVAIVLVAAVFFVSALLRKKMSRVVDQIRSVVAENSPV